MGDSEPPAWATRLSDEDRTKRLVVCGGCGVSIRFDRMAAHLRDDCPGPPEGEAA